MKLWKPRYGWTYLADRAVAGVTLFLSCANLGTGHQLWSVAWVGVALGAQAHARLERRAAEEATEKTSP